MYTKIERRKHEKGAMINQDLQYKKGLIKWISFWRANIHRFLRDFIECNDLKPFQEILLYLMAKSTIFVYIASRGQGKSMLVAWYACIMAILYPGIEIVITSGTKGQAKLMVSEKIEKFAEKYPRLQQCISKIKNNGNETVVIFKGGSTITCVAPNDNARGYRANILIMDEYRMIKKDVIDLVLRRFLASTRSPKFLSRPEYDGFPMDEYEKNKMIYMSSAWLKNHWSWDTFSETVENMCSDESNASNYCGLSVPYTVPLYHGILPLSTVETDLQEMGENSPKWLMEMEAIFYGLSDSCHFPLEDLERAMCLREVFIPDCKLQKGRKNKYDFSLDKKEDGEIRVISVDVAETGSDNTVYIGIRCIPVEEGKGDRKRWYYRKDVVYIDHIRASHPEKKALALKRLYDDFQADYVVMDTNGTSSTLYYACNTKTVDDQRGVVYDAWTAMNDQKLDDIKIDENAKKIIHSVRAFPQFNHECANYTREELMSGRLLLPLSNFDASSEFSDEIGGFSDLSTEESEKTLKTFYESYLLMLELTNLEAVWSDKGLVSIEKPKGGKVKRDRYSALSYGIHFCMGLQLEKLNKKKNQTYSYSSYLFKN